MTGTELYSAISIQTHERAREEQQKLAAISQRLGDVALMDEATREQWVSQQISLATSLKHEQQQQQLMQDLRDLNGRIAAQSQACQEGEAALAAAEAAHGAAAPEREGVRPRRAGPGGPRRSRRAGPPHPGGAAAGEGAGRAWPRTGKLEEQIQQSALTEQQLLAEKIAAEREWGALQPELKRAQELDTRIREKQQQLQKIQQEGRRAGSPADPGAGLAPAAPAGGAAQGPAPAVGGLA